MLTPETAAALASRFKHEYVARESVLLPDRSVAWADTGEPITEESYAAEQARLEAISAELHETFTDMVEATLPYIPAELLEGALRRAMAVASFAGEYGDPLSPASADYWEELAEAYGELVTFAAQAYELGRTSAS